MKENCKRRLHLCTRVQVSYRYGKNSGPSSFYGYAVFLGDPRNDLVLLPLEHGQTLPASLKDALKVTFLAAAIELIGQLRLSQILGEEPAEGVSCLATLEGIQVGTDQMNVLFFSICNENPNTNCISSGLGGGWFWGADQQGQEGGEGHDGGDDVEAGRIRAAALVEVRYEQGAKGAGESPGGEHQAVDRPDVF